ncbi:hypothetical protein BO86DRAFT_458588 [Aspergillus japonicus CBS 114.51]|uniref:Uncharacterized protein n=1 Tax=Aspergillus japonicus CBS 114.51 TaxID=1448312 RepID=A0A8T8WR83_ASPJA|nr:hypothetical protein BO86DRAFT_458588 [Aspergillus japonicus CBS 114.51]RAH78355.1 hypothetical protein BO86DRAFT_458588 [Aspergillus japonicus CBS 114.51]
MCSSLPLLLLLPSQFSFRWVSSPPPPIRLRYQSSAVIDETLRISCPAPGVLPRIVPQGGCVIAGLGFIPGGPLEHQPQRDHLPQDHGSINPSDGSPKKPTAWIIGRLAQMEMTMALAYLFNRFDLALYETDAESLRVSN